MGHQRLQIHQAATDDTKCFRVLVAVPVLELQVDFVGGKVHEGVCLFGFADADNEDFASEADGLWWRERSCQHRTSITAKARMRRTHKDGSPDRALDARTFHRDPDIHPSRLLHFQRNLLGRILHINHTGSNTGHECFGEFETRGEQVGDDDWFTSGCSCGEKGDQTDWSGAAGGSVKESLVSMYMQDMYRVR